MKNEQNKWIKRISAHNKHSSGSNGIICAYPVKKIVLPMSYS